MFRALHPFCLILTQSFLNLAILLAPSYLHAEDSLTLNFGEGLPGDRGVSVLVTARHDDQPVHGFSLALAYPADTLTLQGISSNGTVPETSAAEFFQQKIDQESGHATLGVIFSFPEITGEAVALAPTDPEGQSQVIARLSFAVRTDASPGEYPLRFQDGIMNPPVSNQFTNAGDTIFPELNDGTFVVRSRNVVWIDSISIVPGGRASVFARAQHSLPIAGYELSVVFDRRALELDVSALTNNGMLGTDALNIVGGFSNVEIFQVSLVDDFTPTESMASVGMVIDFLPPDNPVPVLPPNLSDGGQSLVQYIFTATDNAATFGEHFDLQLTDDPSREARTSFILGGGTSIEPEMNNGKIYFSAGTVTGHVNDFVTGEPIGQAEIEMSPLNLDTSTNFSGNYSLSEVPPGTYSVLARAHGYFPNRLFDFVVSGESVVAPDIELFPRPAGNGGYRRGAVTDDDLVDFTDAIESLIFLFLGGTTLSCQKAADIDDNGVVEFNDSIILLRFLFLGEGMISAPFVDCGDDPTPDDLTCELNVACEG